MSDNTAIQWTNRTWNIVTGCTRVSPGCANCYMFRSWPRLRGMGVPGYSGEPSQVHIWPERLAEPFKWSKRPQKAFVVSMGDLFHVNVPFPFVAETFEVMRQTPHVTYQLLTKRPGRLAFFAKNFVGTWPANVWAGTSVECPKYIPRADLLDAVPAPVRFLSCEPLLNPLNLGLQHRPWINWVIAGGESGPNARPMNIEWVRSIRDQCHATAVSFFFKQVGGVTPKAGGRFLDGRTWDELPLPSPRGVQSIASKSGT